MTVLEHFANYVAGFSYEDLASTEQEALSIHFVDTVGAWAVGSRTPDGRALAALRNLLPRSPLDDLAMRCGMIRHTEIDDIHMSSCITPGAVVVPVAAMMSTIAEGSAGGTVADAMGVGYEAMTRLGAAISGPEILYRGVWPTYFAAAFGAAAVTARLFGLSELQTAHALSIALLLSTGGSSSTHGGISARWLTLGNAARAGCVAALAARQGYAGNCALLDGQWMHAVHGIDLQRERLTADLGRNHAIVSTSIKPYCSARQVLGAIHGLRAIVGRGAVLADVQAIRVYVPKWYAAMVDHGVTEGDRLSTLTSVPYQLALSVLDPDGLYNVDRSGPAKAEQYRSFMGRVSVLVDESLNTYYPDAWPTRVEVDTAGGTMGETVMHGPGDPGRPFDRGEMEAKFRRFVSPLLGNGSAHSLAELATEAFRNREQRLELLAVLEQIENSQPTVGLGQ